MALAQTGAMQFSMSPAHLLRLPAASHFSFLLAIAITITALAAVAKLREVADDDVAVD